MIKLERTPPANRVVLPPREVQVAMREDVQIHDHKRPEGQPQGGTDIALSVHGGDSKSSTNKKCGHPSGPTRLSSFAVALDLF